MILKKKNKQFFVLQGIIVSLFYCIGSPDIRDALKRKYYRMKIRWQSRNLTRENTRRFRKSINQKVSLRYFLRTFSMNRPLTWIQYFQSFTISTNLLSLHNSPIQNPDQPMEICTKDFEQDTKSPMPMSNETRFPRE